MNKPPYLIVEEFATVVSEVKAALSLANLNYLYGYLSEVKERLANDSKTVEFREKKYPLIWLVEPFTVKSGGPNNAGNTSLQFFIINGSTIGWTREQRTNNNYKPVIIPIYHELLKQIQVKSDVFEIVNITNHSYTDRPFWGKEQQNAIDDVFDCREINGLEINIANKKNCTFKTF